MKIINGDCLEELKKLPDNSVDLIVTDPVCFFVKGHNKPFYQGKIKAQVKHDCYVKASPEKENTGHPAQKPLEIVEDIITWCSEEGDTVLDPYLGSGSIAIASKKLKRKFIGFEVEENYIEIVKKRLENLDKQETQETLQESKIDGIQGKEVK